MQLLTSGTTPFGRVPRIVIHEHGLDVEEVPVLVWKEREKVVGRNPLSKVPVLLLEDDSPIVDSRVIAQYLDSLGDKPLLPREAIPRLHMQSACAICHGVTECAGAAFAPGAMLNSPLGPEADEWYMSKVRAGLEDMANRVRAGEFGDENAFNMLDAYAISTLGFLEFRLSDRVDWRNEHPDLAEFFDRLHANRQSVKDTIPKMPPQ